MVRGAVVAAVAAVFFVGGAAAGSREETCRNLQSRGWNPSPWHLVDIWHHADEPLPFRSLAMEVEVDGDFTGEGMGKRIYVAPIFGRVGRTDFYLGMQTDVWRPGGREARGFLFSRWGRVRAGDARTAPGGWHQALTDAESKEGDFVGVRLAYPWTAGRYTFQLRPGERDAEGIWVEFRIKDHQSGEWLDGGGLRFPAADWTLGTQFASFVEIYGGQAVDTICRAAMPIRGKVRFGALRINGQPLDGARSQCAFDEGVPPLATIARGAAGADVQFGRWVTGERCGAW